jgi:hypothetical protein
MKISVKQLLKRHKQPKLPKLTKYYIWIGMLLSLQMPLEAVQSESDDNDNGTFRYPSKRLRKTPLDEIRVQLEESKKPASKTQDRYACEEDVELRRGKLPRNKKVLPESYFWRIFFQNKSAGKVFIEPTDIHTLGRQPAIQIFLNKQAQGKHIGRIAYERACRLSHYDIVYASMRRNNIASYKSAQAAGFREIKNMAFKQCVMKWSRIIL